VFDELAVDPDFLHIWDELVLYFSLQFGARFPSLVRLARKHHCMGRSPGMGAAALLHLALF
jgi:hypothetical protein